MKDKELYIYYKYGLCQENDNLLPTFDRAGMTMGKTEENLRHQPENAEKTAFWA